MRTIFKYELPRVLGEIFSIEMCKNAQILTAQMQGSALCLWAEVEDSAPKEERHFLIVGTGHPVPCGSWNLASWNYIGTVQDQDFVWHVYEVKPAKKTIKL